MIDLKKGQKINLTKKDTNLGEILVNLNWNSFTMKKGLFGKLKKVKTGIDLDLACLYELKDGRKDIVQALGNKFGSLNNPPYVALDGDDRTGDNTDGENLRINGNKIAEIKRILIYAFIYEGMANWKEAESVVTIKYPNAEDIVIRMDSFDNTNKLCALALLENVNDTTFSVEKLIQFYPGQPALDKEFNWGLQWVSAKK